MDSRTGDESTPSAERTPGKAVIPARAVLTELARGFLLVHESNPARARQFAETFLREHVGPSEGGLIEVEARVTAARRSLGRFPRGAVEPLPTRLPP
jgi:hypothetical protein